MLPRMDSPNPLAVDVAVHREVGLPATNLLNIARKHGLTREGLRARLVDPEFRRELEMAKSSLSYARNAHQVRCASIAEPMLEMMVALARHPDTKPSDRIKIYELVRRDAKLEPKDDGAVGNDVSITINLENAALVARANLPPGGV